jgi:hypothetical protein
MQRIGVAPGEGVERRLGRAVDGIEPPRPDGGDRGQHDDRAAAPAPHRLAERQQRRDVPGDVGLDHRRGQPHVALGPLLADQHAGRRDHQVRHSPRAQPVGERLMGARLHRVVAGHLDRAAQRLPRGLEPLRIAAGQDHLGVGPEVEGGEDRQSDLTGAAEQ